MKPKHILITYTEFIVVIPAVITHLTRPLRLNVALWKTVVDIIMVLIAVGLALTIIPKRSKFQGWILLAKLLLLVLLSQMFFQKQQARGFTKLRTIYRFALLHITLFVLPLEIHFHRRELCWLIGGLCFFSVLCCVYELIQHPRIWESMSFFSGYNLSLKIPTALVRIAHCG